jgi:hypothetical protein
MFTDFPAVQLWGILVLKKTQPFILLGCGTARTGFGIASMLVAALHKNIKV